MENALDGQTLLAASAVFFGLLAYALTVQGARGGALCALASTVLSVGAALVVAAGEPLRMSWWIALSLLTGPLTYGAARLVRRRSASTPG